MDQISTAITPVWAAVALAAALAVGVLFLYKVFRGEDDPSFFALILSVPVLLGLTAALFFSSGTDFDSKANRKAAWASYSASSCTVFSRQVNAGRDATVSVGGAYLPGKNGGIAPAMGYTEGTHDRVLVGWSCADGSNYVTSDGEVPHNFVIPANFDPAASARHEAPDKRGGDPLASIEEH